PAQQRGQREHREAHQEDPAARDEVTQPPGEQQEAAEGDEVRVDHPGQAGLREPEVGLDRGQRDVHHGRIEHDHQYADAEHQQCYPASTVHRYWHGSSLRYLAYDRQYRPMTAAEFIFGTAMSFAARPG